MGERLVLQVEKPEGTRIASLYYHWSAYTTSALQEIRNLLARYFDPGINLPPYKPDLNPQLRLIRVAETMGGGIDGCEDSSEWDYITQKYPKEKFKTTDINRNDGLIAISESGMKAMQDWVQGSATIILGESVADSRILFNVYWMDTQQSIMEDYEITNKEFHERIVPPPKDLDLTEFTGEQLREVFDFWEQHEEDFVKISNHRYFSAIY